MIGDGSVLRDHIKARPPEPKPRWTWRKVLGALRDLAIVGVVVWFMCWGIASL